MLDYLVPGLLLATCAIGLGKRQEPYGKLLSGAGRGLELVKSILPSLVLLLTAVTMLRASGAMELISGVLTPVFYFFGVPPSVEARHWLWVRS